jgi:hypothetical protein
MYGHTIQGGGGGTSAIAYITLNALLSRNCLSFCPSSLEFDSLRQSNPNIIIKETISDFYPPSPSKKGHISSIVNDQHMKNHNLNI